MNCRCWKCWFQSQFTTMILFAIVCVSFLATVVLMHEQSIDDKYVTWLEGFTGGALTSLAVSLKTSAPGGPHDEPDPNSTTEKVSATVTTTTVTPPQEPKS